MVFPLIIGAIGVGISAAGLGLNIAGQKKASDAAKKQAQITQTQIIPRQQEVLGLQQQLADIQTNARLREFGVQEAIYGTQTAAAADIFRIQNLGFDLQDQAETVRYQSSAASEAVRYNTNAAIDTANYTANQEAEGIRQRAAKLDAAQQRRSAIRAGIVARSQALATGTAQGVRGADSSYQGGLGAISAQVGANVLGVNQQSQLGEELFTTNRTLSDTLFGLNRSSADQLYGITTQAAGDLFTIGRGISSYNRSINTINYNTQRTTGEALATNARAQASEFVQGADINKRISDLYKAITYFGGDISGLQREAADGGSLASIGTGIGSIGNTLVSKQETITNLYNNYFKTPTTPDYTLDVTGGY